ncbi:MAG: hypothetical protein A3E37_03875 [Candidatus Andersenbacteria bacterium RIFCSPHIGHO2_12_FULL_46_9]|nr:MAG: ABC-type multidrug transport system, ATPase component [Parcubacteria group bacterium GW2011_GWA2_45_14]OGY34742.1 MAG: hypothetical protein A3B76_00015 [Candidatus Andersenbacteria bacterium RIFCSPHIGHO2_02_FULL_46_16]OGY36761.1 MAG: hypothetical protein A3E37_03875 [Candidatus Andersenbacteria bacterium RIFCSPHIGHO2_12_FULL_46_9]OGY38098.1 MAG: hypothetical protein A3I08_03800 [Candidatus Andersenbacteria bacterium RIFCSPLOWO2_02_FULL_46_11]OGY38569.1 MAG: hypothetical protein A3G57_03
MADQTAFVDVHSVHLDYVLSRPWFYFFGGNKSTHSALNNITFQLPQATQCTLFGHSAAGKSSLLRLLTGQLLPSRGRITINGRRPGDFKGLSAGYVSAEETENSRDTGYQVLQAYTSTHQVSDAAERIRNVGDQMRLNEFLHRPADTLSLTQKLKLNLARAAISDTPLILLDDVTDQLGAKYIRNLLSETFAGRTVIVATRQARAADVLQLPVLLLHHGSLVHQGTIDEISLDLSCPRVVDVWVEGLRYDMLRQLRHHTGVLEARLIPSHQFAGQRLRITLYSARYLPAMYDLVSQAPLIKVLEIPPSLTDILPRLP